jgi:hypothetical protein
MAGPAEVPWRCIQVALGRGPTVPLGHRLDYRFERLHLLPASGFRFCSFAGMLAGRRPGLVGIFDPATALPERGNLASASD